MRGNTRIIEVIRGDTRRVGHQSTKSQNVCQSDSGFSTGVADHSTKSEKQLSTKSGGPDPVFQTGDSDSVYILKIPYICIYV